MDCAGKLDPYSTRPTGTLRPAGEGVYKPLDPARLRFPEELQGFDGANWLGPHTHLLYQDPKFIKCRNIDPKTWSWPGYRKQSLRDVHALFALWPECRGSR